MAELTKKYLDQAAAEALVTNIKAEDAKNLQLAKDYADSLAPNYEAAGAANAAKEAAIAHANTEIGKVNENLEKKADKTALEAEVTRATEKEAELAGSIAGVDAKADKNAEDIAAINHAENGILAQAKAHTNTEVGKVQGAVDALGAKVGEVPEDSTVMGIIENIQKNAYDDTELRGLISGLDTNKADKTQVATDIADAVKAEEDARKEAVAGVQGAVDTLAGTHATDKKALEDAIALKADKTALDEVSAVANAAVKQADYDVKVKALEDEDARIAGLVNAEAERAAGVEAGLQTQINTIMNNPDAEGAINSINEFTAYVAEHGTIADGMRADINKNKEDIAAHVATDHDFAGADAALKAELEGKINAKADSTVVEGIDGRLETAEGKIEVVEGKVATLEGEMDGVQAAVATKAEQSALEEAVEALEGADADLDERLQAIETQLGDGEGSVADQIADAEQRAKEAAAEDATTKANKALEDAKKYADEEDAKIESRVDALEEASATHALASDVTTLAGRVTTAEGEIDTLQSEMDAVEKKASDNEAAIATINTELAKKAAQTDLDALAGRVTTNEGAIATKAAQADLTALAERVTTAEAGVAENKSAINSFVAISVDEINAMFA